MDNRAYESKPKSKEVVAVSMSWQHCCCIVGLIVFLVALCGAQFTLHILHVHVVEEVVAAPQACHVSLIRSIGQEQHLLDADHTICYIRSPVIESNHKLVFNSVSSLEL